MYRVAGPLLIEATIAVAKGRARKKTTGDEDDAAVVQLSETDFECFLKKDGILCLGYWTLFQPSKEHLATFFF